MIVFSFPFHIFMSFANVRFIRLQGQFLILRTRSCLDLYPLIRPPGRPQALGRGRILIPGFIRSLPTLAVYDVSHSLPLGGVGNGFPFTGDEIRRRFSYLSCTIIKYSEILSQVFSYSQSFLSYSANVVRSWQAYKRAQSSEIVTGSVSLN